MQLTLPKKQNTPAPVNPMTNPYTLEEERLWQRIVGSSVATPEHIAQFESMTGKAHDRNYLI